MVMTLPELYAHSVDVLMTVMVVAEISHRKARAVAE